MNKIQIYTDGSALKNPGMGGLAAIIFVNGQKVKTIVDSYKYTTNNRMEIRASIFALQYVMKNYDNIHSIEVFSDSNYLVKSFNKWMDRWIKENQLKKNRDLFDILYTLKHVNKNKIHFKWVKGHSDNKYNQECDHLARKAAKDNSLKIDEGFK